MRSHKVLIIGILITLLIIGGASSLYVLVIQPPTVTINPSPDTATVLLDNSAFTTRTKKISTGNHKLKVTAPGFVTYEKAFDIKRSQHLTLSILLKQIPSPVTLSTNVSSAPSFSQGSSVYFLGNNGKTLYRTQNNAGQTDIRIQAITPDTLSDIQKIVWQPNAQTALFKRSDGVYLYDFQRYNLLNQTMTLWGTNIDDIVWDPRGTFVAYTYYGADGEQSLIMADIQNKNITRVANLVKEHIDHPSLTWSPDGESILLIDRSAQKKTNYIYSYDIFAKKITQLSTQGEVTGAVWSGDSAHIAYTIPGNDAKGNVARIVWLMDSDGSNAKPLPIAVESASKIAWGKDSKTVIIAGSDTAGEPEKLLQASVDGSVVAFQYNAPSVFKPNYLISLPEDSRVLFLNEGQFMSLSLISPTYE